MASIRIILLSFVLTFAALAGDCLGKNLMNAKVVGRIGGTNVRLTSATYDGKIFKLYAGNNSTDKAHVTIHLGDHAKHIRARRITQIGGGPRIQMGYLPRSGKKIVETVETDYHLKFSFDDPVNKTIKGSFILNVTENNTKLSGKFHFKLGPRSGK